MNDEINQSKEMEYFEYEGNSFLIDKGVLKDVLAASEVVRVPETVKEIRRRAFLNVRAEERMKILIIPASVRKIERLAFAGMCGLCRVEILEPGTFRNCPDLMQVILPDTLRRIESRVFENCTALSDVRLDAVQVSINEDAFLNCRSLKNSKIEAAIAEELQRRKEELEEKRNAKYPLINIMNTKQIQPETEQTEESFNQNTEFCIRNGVLEHCEIGCSHIVIPDGVVTIGKNAFAYSEHKELLKKAELPKSVERLEDRAFYGLSELSEIDFPSTVSYIGAEALEGTAWLKNQRKKKNCVCINGILISAFYDSMALEAKLPEHVLRIAPYAFYRSDVRLVRVPDSVQVIDAYAFTETGMTELELSNNAKLLLHHPVAVRCSKLKEIYIPGMPERIEEGFTEDCPALQRVCIKGTQTAVSRRAFSEYVRIWVV